MNGWIEWLNAVSVALLLGQVWPLLWQSTLLAALVLLANRTLFRKAAPQLRHALWGLVLLRLAVPPVVDLPAGLGQRGVAAVMTQTEQVWVSNAAPASEEVMDRPNAQHLTVSLSIGDAGAIGTPPEPAPTSAAPNTAALFLAFWAFGVLGLTLLAGLHVLRYRRLLRRGVPAPAWVVQLLASYRASLHIRQPVEARVVEGSGSPALFGLVRPVILLPREALAALREDQTRAILAHELAHVKRLDHLINWAQVLIGIVYFLHPVVWLVNRAMRHERELACDDVTLLALGLDRYGYAESLLKVAESLSGEGRLSPVQVGVIEKKNELKTRIRRILDRKIRPVPRLSALSVLAVVLFALCFGTWQSSSAQRERAAAHEENPPTVEMALVDVKVQDAGGQPVAGAEVTPASLRTDLDPGSSFSWRLEFGEPTPVRTDTQGIAKLAYPRYVRERMSTSIVVVGVRHPAYATREWIDYPVDSSSKPIVLQPGIVLRVSGYLEEGKPVTPVHAQLAGTPQTEWTTTEDGTLERRDLQAGEHCIQLVHRDASGAIYFSEPFTFTTKPGVVSEYALRLQPSLRLTGALDDTVPRPVKDGWVEVRVRPATLVSREGNLPGLVEWHTSADVKDDGTFELGNLPPGHATAIAACAGAVSFNPGDNGPSEAQVVELPASPGEASAGTTIHMAATATARILAKDTEGKPVPDLSFQCWPNISYFERTATIFGRSTLDTAQIAFMSKEELSRHQRVAETGTPWRNLGDFAAVTDAGGIATLTALPPWYTTFTLASDTYDLPIQLPGRREQSLELSPSGVTEVTVQVLPKGATQLGVDSPEAPPEPAEATANHGPGPDDMDPPDAFALAVNPAESRKHFEGTVISETGEPLSGVTVDIWTDDDGDSVETDSEGHFLLNDFWIFQDTVEVRFTKAGFSPRYIARQFPGVLAEPLVMTTRTVLEGEIRLSSGAPAARARIRADAGPQDADGQALVQRDVHGHFAETVSDAGGKYRLPVQEGSYTVTVVSGMESTTLHDVRAAQFEASPLDIRLSPSPVFRARVVDSLTGTPVAGLRLVDSRQEEGIEGLSGDDGLIEIPGLPEGERHFFVRTENNDIARWWSASATKIWEREYIDQGERSEADRNWQRNFDGFHFDITRGMETVTIIAEQGARVRGTVLDPDGNPVAGATVGTARTGSGNSITGDTRFSVTTDSTGHFDMLLPASKIREYNLMAHDGRYDEWRTWANGVMAPITTQPGEIVEGAEIRLQPPCVIRGKVVDNAGNPVAGREVRAASTEKHDNRYYLPRSKTDGNGAFEIRFVAPGEHFVQAKPFWLDPAEAPEGTSQTVVASPESPVESVELRVAEDTRRDSWKNAFYGHYKLDEGEALRRVPPPYIPERAAYYRSEHKSQAEAIAEPPEMFAFHWDGTLKNWGLSFMNEPPTLDHIITFALGIARGRFESSEELLKLPLPGDWIVRHMSNPEERLNTLARIMNDTLDFDVQVASRSLPRKVVVVSGAYSFTPLPNAPDDPDAIHLFSDTFSEGSGGGTGAFDKFLDHLANNTDIRFINESEMSGETEVQWRNHDSAKLGRVEGDEARQAVLEQVLENLHRQTGLTFTVEERDIDVWVIEKVGD